MFYSEDEILVNLRCEKCNERLDEPRVLPCASIVCNLCVASILNQKNKFKCLTCTETHEYPLNGFPLSKKILKLLHLKPNEVHRSDSCKSLKQKLNEIQTKIDQFTYGITKGSDQIKEYCIDLRTDVQLATELAIQQINFFNDEFIMKINQYEKECVEAYADNKQGREEFNKIIDEMKQFNAKWTDYLKQFEISDKIITEANEAANKLNQKTDVDKTKLEELIFNGNILKFERNPNKLNSLALGSLLSQVNFTSAILSNKQLKALIKLCNFSESQKWKLIYKASEDGFAAVNFHSKCDGKKNTLTVIKSSNGNVFGGFCQEQWSSDGNWKTDPNAFIYSLINKDSKPLLMKCSSTQHAVYCNPGYSATFGGGHDIFIANNANTNTASYSNIGHSYKHPQFTSGSNEAKTFLAGTYNFTPTEIEVFMKE